MWKSHLPNPVCHKAITLTHLLFECEIDCNTYKGIGMCIKTEVDRVVCNLSVTWIIPSAINNLVLVNSLICNYAVLIYLCEDTLHKHQ